MVNHPNRNRRRDIHFPPVTVAERNAILAGLRLYEALYDFLKRSSEDGDPGEIEVTFGNDIIGLEGFAVFEIATDGGTSPAIDALAVDDLCARINVGGEGEQ